MSNMGGVSLGNSYGKTAVWSSSTAVTAAAGAQIVLSSRTTTAGKTFYLQHLDALGYLSTPSSFTVVNLGNINFQSPSATVIASMTFVNSGGQPLTLWHLDFPEPVPFGSQVTLSANVRSVTATAVTWVTNVVGYER